MKNYIYRKNQRFIKLNQIYRIHLSLKRKYKVIQVVLLETQSSQAIEKMFKKETEMKNGLLVYWFIGLLETIFDLNLDLI